MQRILFSLLLLCSWLSSTSQIDVHVTTLDSFATNASGQQGVYALYAVASDSLIHLSYFYSDSTSRTWLIYGQRSEGSLVLDTIMEITGYSKSLASTAIQLDTLGTIWIYAGYNSNNTRYIKAFRRVNAEWQESFSINQLGTPVQWVAAAPHAREVGFAYCGIRIPPTNLYPIRYASFNGSTWDQVTISEVDKSEKTKHSMASNDSGVYITFAESRCPDTLITRVYVKSDSLWSASFEDIWVGTYDCSSLEEVTTKLGADDAGVYVLQDTHLDEEFPQVYRFDGVAWAQGDVYFDPEWVHPFFMGSNIHSDPYQTMYWINQEKSDQPGLCLLETTGECGYVALPHDQYNINLQDMVVFDGSVYIYYYEGSHSWPWGKPVTFKEARVSIGQIVATDIPEAAAGIQLRQNVPNPFSDATIITCTLPKRMDVQLSISDLFGHPVLQVWQGLLPKGEHSWQVDGSILPEGWYVYTLQADGQRLSKTMVIVH